jgi:hypothetical protein
VDKQEEVTKALLLEEDVDANLVANVINKGYAPDLTDDEVLQIGRDPFLIAYALASPANRCVVTTEASAPSKQRQNRRIPDVCSIVTASADKTARSPDGSHIVTASSHRHGVR